MGQPRPLFRLFSVFSNKHHYNFTAIICEKCPSRIQCLDSNPRPSECESIPMTTIPGFPPWPWKVLNSPVWLFIQTRHSPLQIPQCFSPDVRNCSISVESHCIQLQNLQWTASCVNVPSDRWVQNFSVWSNQFQRDLTVKMDQTELNINAQWKRQKDE